MAKQPRNISVKEGEKVYYLVDANFLANRHINETKVRNIKEQHQIKCEKAWWKEIKEQLKNDQARVYIFDLCIAEAFDPVLHHVALLGGDDPQLVQGLRWTSRSLSLLDLGWRFTSGHEPHFDVVLLRSPRLEDAKRAAVLVDTGGCLYWEIERNRRPHPLCAWAERLPFARVARRTPCSPARLRAHLRAQGFADVRVYWHRPDFQNAVEIVPLENQEILDYVLDGPVGQLRGKAKRWLGRVLRRAGLLQGLVPTISVIACRRACEEAA